jgi:hypothetical protein
MTTHSYNLHPLPQFNAPRCHWMQQMVDREQKRREQESAVRCTRRELQDFRHYLCGARGYDPYNSADLTPEWVRISPPDAVETVPKFRRDYR